MDSALNVLSNTSFKGARLQDVAAESKVSRGAIYWNFKNKVDLYDQVLRRAFDMRIKELYLVLEQDGSAIENITKVVGILLGKSVLTNHKSALLYNGLVLEHPESLKGIINRVDKLFAGLLKKHEEVLFRGIECGELKANLNVKMETRALYNFLWGYYTNKVRFFSGFNADEIKEYVLENFVLTLKRTSKN